MAGDDEVGPGSATGLGERIKKAAEKLGGRNKAAEAMGVSVSQYNRYARGDQQPSLGSAMGLADEAEVSLNWLARGVPDDGEPAVISKGEEGMMHAVIARVTEHMQSRGYDPEPAELADLCLALFRLLREDIRREDGADVARYNEIIDVTLKRYDR